MLFYLFFCFFLRNHTFCIIFILLNVYKTKKTKYFFILTFLRFQNIFLFCRVSCFAIFRLNVLRFCEFGFQLYVHFYLIFTSSIFTVNPQKTQHNLLHQFQKKQRISKKQEYKQTIEACQCHFTVVTPTN